jgi:hypothetical protein
MSQYQYSQNEMTGQSNQQPSISGPKQPIGQQPHSQQMMPGQNQGIAGQPAGGKRSMGTRDMRLEEAFSEDMQIALQDFVEAVKVCEWCADQCIDEGPQMAGCIRLCRDVADIASLNAQLLSRDSVFSPRATELFISAAEACAQECAQHHHRHCQACAEVLQRAVGTSQRMLSGIAQSGGATQPGAQY